MESLHNTASLRNLNVCAHSARLQRKLMFCFGYQAMILACDSAVSVQSEQNLITCNVLPCTLPLARPAHAKIQMLTAIISIVKLIP